MRIAIVGGGASGIVATHFLGNRHDVHLFETAANLGGHVRTLGQNVLVNEMPPGKIAENGPLGFHVATSPVFIGLLKELGIPTKPTALGSNLFLRDKQNYYLRPDLQHWRRRYIERTAGGLETGLSLARFLYRTRCSRKSKNDQKHLGEVLPHLHFLRDWMRCIVMMCYSTPMELVDSMPATFAAANLRDGFLEPEWKFIPGGVHSYQAKILSRFEGKVFLNSPVEKIFRDENGVKLSVHGQMTNYYDKLILATPPGRVLSMLDRPTAIEDKFFSKWEEDIPFRTIAHTDATIYEDKDDPVPTVADYFQKDEKDYGYNCCVSSLYTGTSEFSFAYNLDEIVSSEKQLDSHVHRIPAYSHAALQHRDALINANGERNTYYAGAYLGCGLHEGAVSSANRVAALMGERSLKVETHDQGP